MRAARWLGLIVILGCLLGGCAATPGPSAKDAPGTASPELAMAPSLDPATTAVVARYQARIPELMAQQNVPGLSLAVVDGDHVLWAQGFGYTDDDRQSPITLDTIFSVQSMSKLFTATAVMRAVQDGLLDLDAPITAYLPDFTVHSVFEKQPEQKITLRMLLSHTAGFTHEAPVGNNFELDPGTYDAHIRSISDTWLRFPVGTGYAYSNLGIDLAGYILQTVSGKAFATEMADSLLTPLGMDHSTFDRDRIHATADRAVGHTGFGMPALTSDVAMPGAGGLWTSAADLARFLSFQLGDGTIDGKAVLDGTLMQEMRAIPAPNEGAQSGYALGVMRARWRAGRFQDLFNHGGGGYGFLSDLWWVPSVQLGIAVLTNSAEHNLQGDLALSILRDLVEAPGGAYQQRMLAQPYQTDVLDLDTSYQSPPGMGGWLAALALPASAEQSSRWAGYAGTYQVANWGVLNPGEVPDRFFVEAGVPYFEGGEDRPHAIHRLAEFQPGLFLADNGETLDFRGSQPTWRNLDLVRVQGPAPWQWAALALEGLVALLWFVAVAALVWRRRRNPAPPDGGGRWQWLMLVTATIGALLILANAALLAVLPRLVDAGFIGWLRLPLALRLLLHVPLAVALVAACMVAITVAATARRRWIAGIGLPFVALTVAATLLAVQMAAWQLIGWGFS